MGNVFIYTIKVFEKSVRPFGKMQNGCAWILLIQITCRLVNTLPTPYPIEVIDQQYQNQPIIDNLQPSIDNFPPSIDNLPTIDNSQPSRDNSQPSNTNNNLNEEGKIISVRITSSVAVERGRKGNPHPIPGNTEEFHEEAVSISPSHVAASERIIVTDLPPDLSGANLEFIKQLNAKKEAKNITNTEQNYHNLKQQNNTKIEHLEETQKQQEIYDQDEEYSEIPIARSIPFYPKDLVNYDQTLKTDISQSKVTTVSFNIVHDPPKQISAEPPNSQFNEPSKIYSQPAKIYSVPAKIYSEPAKIYSEPAKIYSEPAKIYSEPAKIYSVPAKFYSQPASLHLDNLWQKNTAPEEVKEEIEQIEEPVSKDDGAEKGKVGYVVEGKEFKKYRVEERTSDGFIVGEYGVVRNEDGALRGVRYTADGEASPSLIHDGLMKFLQL